MNERMKAEKPEICESQYLDASRVDLELGSAWRREDSKISLKI